MNVDDLMRQMLETYPEAHLAEDDDGELIIYTGLKEVAGEVVSFNE